MNETSNFSGLDQARFRNIDLFAPELKSDPVPFFSEWLREGLCYANISGTPSAVATRYHDVATAFADHENLTNEKPRLAGWEKLDYFNGELNIAFSDPPVHTRLRKTLAPLLLPSAIQRLEPKVVEIANQLLVKAGGNTLEVMSQLALPVARNAVLGALLGLPEEDFAVFVALTEEMFSLGDLPAGAGHPASYKAAWAAALSYIDDIVEREHMAPSHSPVGLLVDAHQRGVLTRGEIVAQLVTLYAGGTSPIATLIGSTMLMLARHPDQLSLLRARPALLDAAIDEVLRYHSPGLFNFRFARRDFNFNGLPVLEGMPVYIVGHAANFDSAIYSNPYKFDILRERKPLLAFGRGIHFCIGFHTARMVTRAVIGVVLDSFRNFALNDETPTIYTGNPQERAPVSITLKVERRNRP